MIKLLAFGQRMEVNIRIGMILILTTHQIGLAYNVFENIWIMEHSEMGFVQHAFLSCRKLAEVISRPDQQNWKTRITFFQWLFPCAQQIGLSSIAPVFIVGYVQPGRHVSSNRSNNPNSSILEKHRGDP